MSCSIRSLMKDKKGVAALEYSILAGLIVLGVVATISTSNIKENMQGIFTNVNTALSNAKNAGTATGGGNTNTGGNATGGSGT